MRNYERFHSAVIRFGLNDISENASRFLGRNKDEAEVLAANFVQTISGTYPLVQVDFSPIYYLLDKEFIWRHLFWADSAVFNCQIGHSSFMSSWFELIPAEEVAKMVTDESPRDTWSHGH